MHLRKPEFWRAVQFALATAVPILVGMQISVEIRARQWGAAALWAAVAFAFDYVRRGADAVLAWLAAKGDEARAEAALSSTNQQMQDLALTSMRDAVAKGRVTVHGGGLGVPGGPTH